MADPHPTDAAGPSPPARGRSMLSMIAALATITVVIAAEATAAFLLIPAATPGDPAAAQTAAGEAPGAKEQPGTAKAPGDAPDADAAVLERAMHVTPATDAVEVDLEKYGIHMTIPAEDRTLRIDFHLFGLVSAKEGASFPATWEAFRHRLRDRVIAEFRTASRDELADPELHLLKRRVVAKSNQILGRPVLQAIIISEFRCVEL